MSLEKRTPPTPARTRSSVSKPLVAEASRGPRARCLWSGWSFADGGSPEIGHPLAVYLIPRKPRDVSTGDSSVFQDLFWGSKGCRMLSCLVFLGGLCLLVRFSGGPLPVCCGLISSVVPWACLMRTRDFPLCSLDPRKGTFDGSHMSQVLFFAKRSAQPKRRPGAAWQSFRAGFWPVKDSWAWSFGPPLVRFSGNIGTLWWAVGEVRS